VATSKAKKSKVLDEVRKILQDNRNVVVTEYRGLDVEKMTELRSTFRKSGIKFKVLKNTLTKKLLTEVGITGLDAHLNGPVAVGFLTKDVATSAKTILDYAKKNELLVVKAGVIDGKIVDLAALKAISSLPSREVLLVMLLSTMQGSTKNLLSVLQGTTRKLVYALQAIKEQKAKQAAA
jgi:large subunit ribosomal protein L10